MRTAMPARSAAPLLLPLALALALALAPAAGCQCGGTTPDEALRQIVLIGTARDVWFNVSIFAATATLASDPACPVVTTMGTTTLYEGGCTDVDGAAWSGSATLDGDPNGDFTMVWAGYSQEADVDCGGTAARATNTLDGSLAVSDTATGVASFDANVRRTSTSDNPDACPPLTIDDAWSYAGTVTDGPDMDMDLSPDDQTFDGSGTVSRLVDGESFEASAATAAQLVDRVACDQEPLSGTTTFTLGETVGVLTNDGATDCDDPPTGQWTLDGAGQGEVPIGGVCTIARLTDVASPAALAIAGAALLLAGALRRTRRERAVR